MSDIKIQYCSDLHLEFDDNRQYLINNPIEAKGEILILAGDVAYLQKRYFKDRFFDDISAKFERVYWIPGNHEYYNSADITARGLCFEQEIRNNVILLNNKVIHHKNVRMIFTTLWSHIHEKNAKLVTEWITDFKVIKYKNETLTPSGFNEIHAECLDFLLNELEKPFEGKTIVVTHHLPSKACVSQQFVNSPTNDAFCVDLSALINNSNIDYWIYGHSHDNISGIKVGRTEIVCNQLGYVKYNENEWYRNDACLTL